MKINLPNILLIVIDTLRYDYSKPLWDLLRKWDFVKYNKVVASAAWTLPSHASMFTGLYPSFHGAHETLSGKVYPIRIRNKLLTKILRGMGYANYGFTSNLIVSPALGFEYFDYFYEKPHVYGFLSLSFDENKYLEKISKSRTSTLGRYYLILRDKKIKLITKIALRYLLTSTKTKQYFDILYALLNRQHKNKGAKKIIKSVVRQLYSSRNPYFIFINFMEVHEPYSLYEIIHPGCALRYLMIHGVGEKKIIEKWKANYGKQVLQVTKRLNELLEYLDTMNYLRDSLVIITSDHGQLLGEYGGIIDHIAFLYDEITRVPLFIRYPDDLKLKEFKDQHLYWISNIKIYHLIFSVIESFRYGREFNESLLYAAKVLSESFGIHSMPVSMCHSSGQCKFLKYSKRRIAVYNGPYKVVYNLSDNIIEEIKSFDGTSVSENKLNELLHYIKNYVKLVHMMASLKRLKHLHG